MSAFHVGRLQGVRPHIGDGEGGDLVLDQLPVAVTCLVADVARFLPLIWAGPPVLDDGDRAVLKLLVVVYRLKKTQ